MKPLFYEFDLQTLNILICFLPFFLLIDIYLTWYFKNKGTKILTPYYRLNSKVDFLYASLFKTFWAAILMSIYLFYMDEFRRPFLFSIVLIAYFYGVLQLVYQMIKNKLS